MNNNESGYALSSALILSFLISTLLFLVLYTASFYMLLDIWKIKKTKLNNASESALNLVLSDSSFTVKDSLTIGIDSIDVRVNINQRGLFYNLKAISCGDRFRTKLNYLVANYYSDLNNNALVISKPNFRGAISGDTKITGDITATSDKLNQGKIVGIQKTSNDFLKGSITKNENIVGKYYDENILLKWTDKIKHFKNIDNDYDSDLTLTKELVTDIIMYKEIKVSGRVIVEDSLILDSFAESLMIYTTEGVSFSNGSVIDGNVDFFTDSTIIVEENVHLKDVTLTSLGDCKISENSRFENVQLFSKRNVLINGAHFSFPSVIAIYVDCDKAENLQNKIELSSSVFNGSILLLSSTLGLNSNKSMIVLGEGTQVQGFVYSENLLDAECTVSGSVYAYELYFYKSPTEYRNWLVNTKINIKTLDSNFLLPFGFKVPTKARVIKKQWYN